MLLGGLAILIICSSGAITQVLTRDITYSVIASLPELGMSVKVVVGDKSYPLQSSANSILFKGKAPVSTSESGYHYALYKNDQLSVSEPFSRNSVFENTVNEFFNRSKNTHEISPLPQVYPPLPVINRINSGLHIEGQIATIHLWGKQSDIDNMHNNQLQDIKIKLNMDYIGLNDVKGFKQVKVSLSGRTSTLVEKLSYTLKLKEKNNSLFGYKNFKLRALAFDSSYIREHTVFSCIKFAGIPSSGFSYVRLFINKKPIGLFGFIETFQDPWVANEFANGDKKYQPGNLYQGVSVKFDAKELISSNLKYLGENLTAYNLGEYKVKAGKDKDKKPKVFINLKDFTKFVDQTTPETSIGEWEKHLDTEGFIRSMALEDLLGFSDGYMATANNFYLYDDPKRPGRMIYIPSDLDTTIGYSLFYLNLMLSGNYSEHPGFNFQPLTIKLFSNPNLLQKYKDTILKLAEELVHPYIITPRIDSVVNMIRTDVEWDKSLKRVGKNFRKGLMRDPALLRFYPPGFNYQAFGRFETFEFDESINGPLNSTNRESIKGFINKKVENVLKFYKKLK